MSMSEVACGPSNSRSKLVRFSEKFMDFLCNMNILGISREGVEGCGKGVHMLSMSTYLRWMDVRDISDKVFNEGEVFNEVWMMQMLTS